MSKLYIQEAKDAGNLSVDLLFSDQTTRRVDIGDFIRRHPHPQYNKYLDPRKFRQFSIENGNVVWGKSWDLIFPIEQLHAGVYWYLCVRLSCRFFSGRGQQFCFL